jgi:photosystem II stability/assembly factor-like uncharacterized protein
VTPALRATVDGGQHWETRSLPGDGRMVAGVDFVSESRGWVLVENPRGPTTLYATGDGGRTWTSLAIGTGAAGLDPNDHLEGVRFEDANRGWIGAWRSNGRGAVGPEYYSTADGGRNWTAQALPVATGGASGSTSLYVDPPQRQADGSLVGGVMFLAGAGSEAQIFGAGTAPETWSLLLRSAPGPMMPAWSVGGGRLLAASGQSARLGARTTAPTVEQSALPAGIASLQLVTPTDGFAVAAGTGPGAAPVLYHTADGGRSWQGRAPLDTR